MTINKALYSSAKDDWETPDDFFAQLDSHFHFILDAAANTVNRKCRRWFGPGGEAADALDVTWPVDQGNIWVNPPYSKQRAFVSKACDELRPRDTGAHLSSVVLLLPARTDTRVFHTLLWPRATLLFVRGRLRFKGATHPAPFPSLVAIVQNQFVESCCGILNPTAVPPP